MRPLLQSLAGMDSMQNQSVLRNGGAGRTAIFRGAWKSGAVPFSLRIADCGIQMWDIFALFSRFVVHKADTSHKYKDVTMREKINVDIFFMRRKDAYNKWVIKRIFIPFVDVAFFVIKCFVLSTLTFCLFSFYEIVLKWMYFCC